MLLHQHNWNSMLSVDIWFSFPMLCSFGRMTLWSGGGPQEDLHGFVTNLIGMMMGIEEITDMNTEKLGPGRLWALVETHHQPRDSCSLLYTAGWAGRFIVHSWVTRWVYYIQYNKQGVMIYSWKRRWVYYIQLNEKVGLSSFSWMKG